MATELLAAKLFIPPLRPSLVPRPRLIKVLNDGLHRQHKLTLLSAPAGFGKTTLVVDWLKQVDLSAAWLSLDKADNDVPRFLAYLAGALQQVDEEIGAPLRAALQTPRLPPMEIALTGLLNEIATRPKPLILVLDDYQQLCEAAVLQVIAFLLDHQPPQLHLVLATREDPDLPVARLRARDQLTEIRAGDLRFTPAEAGAFLRDALGLGLSAQDVAALEDRTEGWVVGLQLAGLSLQKQVNVKLFIADFSGSHRHILDYLTGEVLQQQPKDVQAFLLQTAILERLCGPLCDAVTGRGDGDTVLAQLEAANLFVIPLDEARRWYRYHHLFAELLRSQLARAQPGQIPELHRRAGRWYAENGDVEAAIDHALQDTDLTEAANLIEQHVFPQLYQGQVTLVLGWFARLPEAILGSAPMLCIGKAWALALMQRGARPEAVERALQTADAALDRVNAGQELRDLVAGHKATIQAFLLRSAALQGRAPQKLIALSQAAQQLLPPEERGIRCVNALNIGYAYLVLADLPAAEEAYRQVLDDGLAGGNLYAAIFGPTNLVLVALLKGRLHEALYLCETYSARFSRILAGRSFPPIGALSILRGGILLEYGRLAEAQPVLLEGLDLIRWTGEYEAYFTGYTALTRLYAMQRERPAMLQAVKTLEEVWPEGAFYSQALCQILSLRYWPTDSDVQAAARAWLAQAAIDFAQLPVIDSVVLMSMAQFETYLGAAYILARLPKAEAPTYYLEDVHGYLARQQDFAADHAFAAPLVEIAVTRTLLYEAAGQRNEALRMLGVAINTAVPTGMFRIFVDEGERLGVLLKEIKASLADESVAAYVDRLLIALKCESLHAEATPGTRPEAKDEPAALLSERELEVLRLLAKGLTYEEVGRQLFLSLNTVQFHVKNIYGKLLVNRRVQAIERAREMHLI
jgi:LuxR family maltose regulon positive regulatory protein